MTNEEIFAKARARIGPSTHPAPPKVLPKIGEPTVDNIKEGDEVRILPFAWTLKADWSGGRNGFRHRPHDYIWLKGTVVTGGRFPISNGVFVQFDKSQNEFAVAEDYERWNNCPLFFTWEQVSKGIKHLYTQHEFAQGDIVRHKKPDEAGYSAFGEVIEVTGCLYTCPGIYEMQVDWVCPDDGCTAETSETSETVDFMFKRRYFAKPDTWFKEGSECFRGATLWPEGSLTNEDGEKTGTSVYTGIYVVGSSDGNPNDQRWYKMGHKDGDEITMNESCTNDEFDVVDETDIEGEENVGTACLR